MAVRALCDSTIRSDTHLDFKKGEIMLVIHMEPEGGGRWIAQKGQGRFVFYLAEQTCGGDFFQVDD